MGRPGPLELVWVGQRRRDEALLVDVVAILCLEPPGLSVHTDTDGLALADILVDFVANDALASICTVADFYSLAYLVAPDTACKCTCMPAV